MRNSANRSFFFAPLQLESLFLPFFLLFGLLLSPSFAFAEGTHSFVKVLDNANPSVQPGETVIYRLSMSCNSLTGGCGQLTITDAIPPELEVISCNVPPGFTTNCPSVGPVASPPASLAFSRDPFDGGDTFNITINTRVRPGQSAANGIANTSASVITDPAPSSPGTIVSSADPIIILPGAQNYVARKQRLDPSPPLEIAAGSQVRYRVQLCSLTAIGNVDLTAATLTDTYLNPDPGGLNATLFVLATGGGTPDAAASTSTQVNWNLGAVDLGTLYAGQDANSEQCISREFLVQYGPSYSVGDPVPNTVAASVTPEGASPVPLAPVTLNDQIGAPTPGANVSKWSPDVTPPATLSWWLEVNNNNSNVPLQDFVVVDELPGSPTFAVAQVSSGEWPSGETLDYNVVADVQYSAAGAGGPWTSFPNGTGLEGNANTTWSASGDFPANITHIRWVFRNTSPVQPANEIPRGFRFTSSPLITQTVPAGATVGANPTNCVSASFAGGSAGPGCYTPNIEAPTPAIRAMKTALDGTDLRPGDEARFLLSFSHISGDTTGDIINPTVADLLPDNLEFVGWEDYTGPPGKPEPNIELIPNFSSGSTLVRFTWSNPAPAGSLTRTGAPGVANAASFDPSNDPMPQMTIRVRVKPATAANVYNNQVAVFDNGPRKTCSLQASDTDDLDGDSDTAETACVGYQNYVVLTAAVLGGEKWIKGDNALGNVDDPTTLPAIPNASCPDYGATYGGSSDGYTRFPCVARTGHGSAFTYRLRLTNLGNVDIRQYVLYDVLPLVGDTGSGEPLSATPRDTRWRPFLAGPITVESSLTGANPVIEYSVAANACRPEVSNDNQVSPPEHWQPGCDNASWTTVVPADPGTVRHFRIRAFAGASNWLPGQVMTVLVPMQSPAAGAPPSIPTDPAIFNPAWNSFAHRVSEAGGGVLLPTAEPRKVGIILPERYRIGNLVWRDDNNDGVAQIGEPGIPGVQVQLWTDTDGTPGPSAGDVQVGTTATDASGKYLFDTLPAGNYYVVIPPGQAAARWLFLLHQRPGEQSQQRWR
ncbi:MAG: SdrD B-like domain-containing protein [Candidatus Competibacter sp.]